MGLQEKLELLRLRKHNNNLRPVYKLSCISYPFPWDRIGDMNWVESSIGLLLANDECLSVRTIDYLEVYKYWCGG